MATRRRRTAVQSPVVASSSAVVDFPGSVVFVSFTTQLRLHIPSKIRRGSYSVVGHMDRAPLLYARKSIIPVTVDQPWAERTPDALHHGRFSPRRDLLRPIL